MSSPVVRRGFALGLFGLVGVSLLPAGCGNDDAGTVAEGPTTTPATTPTTTPTTSTTPAATSTTSEGRPDGGPTSGGGSGRAVSRSDTGDVPDSPIAHGEVLFLPPSAATDLAADGGVDGGAEALRHASFVVDRARLEALGGMAATIDGKGTFEVPVSGGTYLVCLADIFVGHDDGPPYHVVGCAEGDVPGDRGITVGHGEGGVDVAAD